MLHETTLDRERLVEGQSLIPRSVRTALDEDHNAHAEGVTRHPERLSVGAGKGEDGRMELEVVAVKLDRELRVRLGNRDGEDVRGGAVREASRELGRLDDGFDVGSHREDRVVGRLFDPLATS